MQSTYKNIIETENYVVASEYEPIKKDRTAFQSEAELEKEFIARLTHNGYEYITINNEADLINNLRFNIEKLNNIKFTNNEWKNFFETNIANPNLSIVDKTITIQRDEVKTLKRDNGDYINVKLIDKKILFNNELQVINQYSNSGSEHNRYDVTILINGLPLVHIELKKRGVNLKEAFNQIERYQIESFWSNSGLYEFVQIFIISNGTLTKYYSNSTRWNVTDGKSEAKRQRTSNSFEFTSFWADAKNNSIYDIDDFSNTFLAKRNILKMICEYSILTVDNELLVMRPYQIAAAERIINRIQIANNYKWYGSIKAGGYIWHTTGSGKTLTSFKTATLAKELDFIDKVLFIVDRKDLDYQTMKEYDRFQKGAANGNKSTAILKGQLEDDKAKIIVTTIQKLNVFIKQNKKHPIYSKKVVMIFDECHRSQFGEAHKNIVKNFKSYFIFGFTGTPIFAENAVKTKNPFFSTTEQTFGDKLHTYTIIDAIRDGNVLRFLVDNVKTMSKKDDVEDEEVSSIDSVGALIDDTRIDNNVNYILKNFGGDENSDSTDGLDKTAKTYLKEAIDDYNNIYKTNFDISGDKFQNYYKDVSIRMKKKELDLLIVVNMFLTGFDAKTLNTLWVDKNLKYHGLLQAFSRTNRIYNSVKAYGNIVCFRNLDKRIEESLTLFGDKDAGGLILLKDYNSYYYGFTDDKGNYHKGYKELVDLLKGKYSSTQVPLKKEDKKSFINIFNAILNVMNILAVFARFDSERLISDYDMQNYMTIYSSIRDEFKKNKKDSDKVDITDDIVFETELVKQFEVDIDYILNLIAKYKNTKDKTIIPTIKKLVDASYNLRSKKVLIDAFLENIDAISNVDEEWQAFVLNKAKDELDKIIEENNLKSNETISLLDFAFKNEKLNLEGTILDKIMPAISIFGGRAKKKEMLVVILNNYFEKYNGIVSKLIDNNIM